MDKPFIKLDNVTIRIRDRMVFPNTDWEIRTGQQWAILGPNGAGKSSLARVLINDIPYSRGTVTNHLGGMPAGYVSFELHDWMINTEEMRRDDRSARRSSPGRELARDALVYGNGRVTPGSPFFEKVVKQMKIGHLLDRELRNLSTGEIRKALIARALLKSPRLLILDEPLSGLDSASRAELTEVIDGLASFGTQLILITNHPEEVLSCITHVLCVKDCAILGRGKKAEMLKAGVLERLYGPSPSGSAMKAEPVKAPADKGRPLIEMRNVTVRYGKTKILDSLNWKMCSGENWAITGPNGSGKTTLLKLITGDNLQGYANRIFLFGQRKGSGEMLWETKQRIGFLSSDQLVSYRKTTKVVDVVASGFFESVGLYRNLSEKQREDVRRWMELLAITRLRERPFEQTSYGEKRLVMIARALVKSPELLILDEPCEGLDPANRKAVIDLADHVGRDTPTDLIYVTHYPEELPGCITHKLELQTPA